MNNWFHTLVVAAQITLVGSAVWLEQLSQSKMGVMRHVLYTNAKWERLWPLDWITNSAIGILLILATLFVVQWVSRRATMLKKNSAQIAAAISLALMTSAFMVLCSTVTLRTYYVLCAVFFLTTLLQFAVGWAVLRAR